MNASNYLLDRNHDLRPFFALPQDNWISATLSNLNYTYLIFIFDSFKGTFFRKAIPATSFMDMQTDQLLPPIRVVFDVSIKGAALKLVTVRSALLVENKLLEAMELRLDNTTLRSNDLQHLVIPSEQVIPVPLSYAWSKMTGKNMFFVLFKGSRSKLLQSKVHCVKTTLQCVQIQRLNRKK